MKKKITNIRYHDNRKTRHLHCRGIFARKLVCCVAEHKIRLTNGPTEEKIVS